MAKKGSTARPVKNAVSDTGSSLWRMAVASLLVPSRQPRQSAADISSDMPPADAGHPIGSLPTACRHADHTIQPTGYRPFHVKPTANRQVFHPIDPCQNLRKTLFLKRQTVFSRPCDEDRVDDV